MAAAAEVAGGFTGYLLYLFSDGELDDTMYGTLFGMVNGMVLVIAVLEFLPHAIAMDDTPGHFWSSGSFFLGMVFISITLVVEQY